MAWKRKAPGPEADAGEHERFYGCVIEMQGDKMWVSCEGLPPEHANKPPKILGHKSRPPPGLKLGSWITFDLLDEWPGENWGSLLCVNIEHAEPPEGMDEEVEEEEQPSFVRPQPKCKPAARSSLAAAAAKLKAAISSPAQQAQATPLAQTWKKAKVKEAAHPQPAFRSSLATGAAKLKAFVNSSAPKFISAATPVSQKQKVATAASGVVGILKSSAVAQFRQARQQGLTFSAGWKDKGSNGASALSPRDDVAFHSHIENLEPIQKMFLQTPEILDEETMTDIMQKRDAMEVSVEVPEGVPDVFPPLDAFENLEGILPEYTFKALAGMGIETPMPIQAQSLPLALAGLDIVGIAKTGSGKTLAYLLPALPHIEAQSPLPKQRRGPIALILAPTRELAVQISDQAKKVVNVSRSSSNHPGGLGAAVLYGGGGGSKGWQVAEIQKGGHFVAATPGRLIDCMDGGDVSLSRVTYLVLDEADRMLECGFEDQVGRIAQTVRNDRQTLFFSATWPTEVQELATKMCCSETPPVRVYVGQRTDGGGPTSRGDIAQEVVVFDQATWEERDQAKQELLYAHLREVMAVDEHKTLVFVSRKDLADELSKRLWNEGFKTNVMHGGKAQDTRLAVLEEFRCGETKLLVTTDVMGRGLDIPGISHVVVFDMGDIEDYIHRIGRTARGPYGIGHALTFFEYDKKWPDLPRQLADVLEQSGQEVPEELVAMANGGRHWEGWR
eukprot:TRINITY_DN1497_c2_g1_i1.p1 TRINITY_DN1497_c2_g1~~TRINITY_DN1497_c2_g1_i1.p1  ORF type:complete len:739 (+),score=135.35 TRINITY_DN1497_c2_g1_i1:36-2219(+)